MKIYTRTVLKMLEASDNDDGLECPCLCHELEGIDSCAICAGTSIPAEELAELPAEYRINPPAQKELWSMAEFDAIGFFDRPREEENDDA